MSARDVIVSELARISRVDMSEAPAYARASVRTAALHVERALTAAGYRIVGPDEVALITTALEHASFALDGVVALDDEDEGKDGASKTCQHTKRTVDRALTAIRAIASGGKQ